MSTLARGLVAAGCCLAFAACEKPTPFEITSPPTNNSPAPTFDASIAPFDSSVGNNNGDGAVIDEAPAVFTQAALLKSIGECALGRYRDLVPFMSALRDATRDNASALNDDARTKAQQAWRAAIERWQELELFHFGPAGSSSEPGGKDIRNNIYFFPDASTCQVDFSLVNRAYEMGAQATSVSGRGLSALEYLLFGAASTNTCGATSPINEDDGSGTPWQKLSADELRRRRADYAAVLGADLVEQVNALVSAWDPAQGNYLTAFQTAGAGSTLFATAKDAFNLIDNAMFYWDKELKDFKVAIPAGISDFCGADSCPDQAESRLSGMSNVNIRANISGFRLLFNGCGPGYTGLGFDDWLRAIGKEDLATRMSNAIIAADNAAAALPLPIAQLVTTDVAQVRALHAALKGVSDPLKSELVGALNLELPTAAQGDND